MALLMNNLWASSNFGLCSEIKKQSRTQVRCAVRDSTVSRSDSVEGTGFASAVEENKDKGSSLSDFGNGHMGMGSKKEKKIREKFLQEQGLKTLWDDGYGNQSVEDYFVLAKEMIKSDGGPPRWFSPASCGPPLENSPLLLFLPGMDGLGLGLILHHKALGRVFELWCLHIPVNDRTPFEGMVQSVEETVRTQHALFPNRPIYLVGDSFGGCLALSVAARNPNIDLVLVLANPATSFSRSQLQSLLPLLESFPNELHSTVPYFLSLVMGEPTKMASVTIDSSLPPRLYVEQLSSKLSGLLPLLPGMADIIPKEALVWKLKLLKSAAGYANSRLHAVTAEVLVLASGKDNVLPSREEARRLEKSIKNCKMKYFKDNGHTMLLEDGVNLLTIIKATLKYRHARRYDPVLDYLPPSSSEFKQAFENSRRYRYLTGPVMLSTLEDGTVVRGLSGVPSEGPVLLVGNHNLMGLELYPLVEEFLRDKGILLRGMAHPSIFLDMVDGEDFTYIDTLKLYGATPVAAANLFKLLERSSHVLLYPGGAREALHRKGETYAVIWPEQQEFVRMAARFGATIVPFGAIGEDDIAEVVLDYDDQMKIPILNDYLKKSNELEGVNARAGATGEVANQALHIPVFLPKVPGRLYYYFGKPIPTKGRQDILKDKQKAREMYLQIKSDVENNISYLLNKRQKDPYRNIFERTAYRAFSAPIDQVPTFKHSS